MKTAKSADSAVARELADFEAGRLDPKMFPHREHLRLGFEMLRRYSFAQTLERFSAALKLLAAKAGKPEVYHETKTVAFLALIAERRARASQQHWEEFIAQNADLGDKRCLERIYCVDDLESIAARDAFILPKPVRARGGWSMVRTIGVYALVFSLYIIWSSGMTFVKAHGHHGHEALLAVVEILAAVLFCFRRTRAAGLALLLLVFLFATIIEISVGAMPARFVYYAASALLVWCLTPAKRERSACKIHFDLGVNAEHI